MFNNKRLIDAERRLFTYHSTLSKHFLECLPTILAQNNDNYLKLALGISVEINVHGNEKVPHGEDHQLEFADIMEECLKEFELLIKVCNATISAHYEVSDNKIDFDPFKAIPEDVKKDLISMFNLIFETFFCDSIKLSQDYRCNACFMEFSRIYNEI